MRTERLFGIVSILLYGDTVSAGKLADKFGVSVRTIYRDIDILSVAGVPVCMKKGYGGGISILEGYRLGGAVLDDNDIEKLLMSIGVLKTADPEGSNALLEKLAVVFTNHNVTDWVEFDFTHWGTNNKNDTKLEKMKNAILQRRQVEITYFNSFGQRTTRILAPIKLLYKSNSWYVKAYCFNKKDVRIFKILRIKDFTILETKFDRKLYENIQPISKSKNIQSIDVDLKLKFSSEVLFLLHDWYGEDEITRSSDGSYLVETTFPMDEWVYSHILSYGDKVEVIGPAYIREEIQKRLSTILTKYNEKS